MSFRDFRGPKPLPITTAFPSSISRDFSPTTTREKIHFIQSKHSDPPILYSEPTCRRVNKLSDLHWSRLGVFLKLSFLFSMKLSHPFSSMQRVQTRVFFRSSELELHRSSRFLLNGSESAVAHNLLKIFIFDLFPFTLDSNLLW